MKSTLKTPCFLLAAATTLTATVAEAAEPLTPTAALAAPADPPKPPPPAVLVGNVTPRERVWTWDLNIDGAYGRIFPEDVPARGTAFARIRAGVLRIHDSLYWSFGPTYEISKIQPTTFGLQGEVMHIETGLWCQIGALIDVAPHPGFMAAVGWSLLGVEFQLRDYDRYGVGEAPAVYGKIRIPIGIIARAFK